MPEQDLIILAIMDFADLKFALKNMDCEIKSEHKILSNILADEEIDNSSKHQIVKIASKLSDYSAALKEIKTDILNTNKKISPLLKDGEESSKHYKKIYKTVLVKTTNLLAGVQLDIQTCNNVIFPKRDFDLRHCSIEK